MFDWSTITKPAGPPVVSAELELVVDDVVPDEFALPVLMFAVPSEVLVVLPSFDATVLLLAPVAPDTATWSPTVALSLLLPLAVLPPLCDVAWPLFVVRVFWSMIVKPAAWAAPVASVMAAATTSMNPTP